MEIGLCPHCARPYTAGEVTGVGILRARPAQRGGPTVEFQCPRCGHRILLVPHGQGRYARPGQPPPPPVPAEARRPPWLEGAPAPEPEEPEVIDIPVEDDATEAPRRGPVSAEDTALTPLEALDILGLSPTDGPDAIEAAFRERSLTCHPDKVAHLDRDFQALAEKKFKLLKRAYDLLMG
ncbi:MAG: J domain-containing protein [Planctomycetota bacterium]|jgi:hypothetical protein